MPSTSHGKCKICRRVIHARHRFGMCKQCSDKHYARITAERRESKRRQARRALLASTPPVLTDLEEDQPMDETKAPPDKSPRSYSKLTDQQQVEILDAYTQTDEPVGDITRRFGIRGTYIYNVLDRVGVSWRRGNPESFATWQARQAKPVEVEPSVPEPVEKALENMLRLPADGGPQAQKLPPTPEPVAPTPSVDRRTQAAEPLQTWRVQVSGFLTIQATSIEEALFEAKRRGGPLVKITYMQLVED